MQQHHTHQQHPQQVRKGFACQSPRVIVLIRNNSQGLSQHSIAAYGVMGNPLVVAAGGANSGVGAGGGVGVGGVGGVGVGSGGQDLVVGGDMGGAGGVGLGGVDGVGGVGGGADKNLRPISPATIQCGISDDELVSLSVRDLNRALKMRGLTKDEIVTMKQR